MDTNNHYTFDFTSTSSIQQLTLYTFVHPFRVLGEIPHSYLAMHSKKEA